MPETPDEALIAEARSLTPEGRTMLTSHERMMHRLADALEKSITMHNIGALPDEQLDAIEERAEKPRQYAEHHGVKIWTEHIFALLADQDALLAEVRRLRALSAHPAEETVTTVAELDALPLGSVLALESTPTRAEVVVGQGDGWGTRFGTLNSTEVIDAFGRLRVLFRPVPEGSET